MRSELQALVPVNVAGHIKVAIVCIKDVSPGGTCAMTINLTLSMWKSSFAGAVRSTDVGQ